MLAQKNELLTIPWVVRELCGRLASLSRRTPSPTTRVSTCVNGGKLATSLLTAMVAHIGGGTRNFAAAPQNFAEDI
jgi:hypothetical protein